MMICSEEVDERYKNGKIYQIVCNITGEVYIGSTKAYLTDRMSKHLNENNMHDCVSKRIIDRGDYTHQVLLKIILVEIKANSFGVNDIILKL